MPLTTNFNVNPYFDDYDPAKNYYRILFRPTTAIQARELNQMQTILQKQIERFGSNIFKEGSIVLDGIFDPQLRVPYVIVDLPTSDITPESFLNKKVVGQKNGVEAIVTNYTYDTDLSKYVFYVKYTKSSTVTDVFGLEEIINVVGDTTLYFTSTDTDATGFGSLFSISQGVLFTKGFFAAFPKQTVVISKYSTIPTAAIGFNIEENIITDLQDESLLDNALGSYNENAPGAHRFNLEPTLIVKDYEAAFQDPNFVLLMSFRDGNIEEYKQRSQYNIIADEMAKRTFDESGDYYVNGLKCLTREHYNNGSNEGVYTANNGGNNSLLSVEVAPGLAYVKGYQVNNLSTKHLPIKKSIDYKVISSQPITMRSGSYFYIKEITGTPALDQGTTVNLYGTAETRLTSMKDKDYSASSSPIGTARVKYIVYESGTIGTPACQYRLYLYDFNMSTGVIADVRAVGIASTFFADVVTTYFAANTTTKAVLVDQNYGSLIASLGTQYTRSIRSSGGNPDTTFTFSRTENKSISFGVGGTGGNVSVTVSTDYEDIGFGDGTLDSSEKRNIILSISSDTNITLSGTVSGSNGTYTLTGSGTDFITQLKDYDRITVNGVAYYVNGAPTSATSLSLRNSISGGSVVANVIQRSYYAGDIIDLTKTGTNGSTRTAVVSSKTLSIGLNELSSITGTVNCVLTYPVVRTTAKEIKKTLNDNRYVKIDCTGFTANQLTQAIYLGLPDVYKVRNIWKGTSAFVAEGSSTQDVTSSFTFDNGQRDSFYDHASITAKPGVISNTNHLLVKLDHFSADYSTGYGFFSVDSYPIDDTTTSNSTIFTYQIPSYTSVKLGEVYNMRDVLDFRPFKANTAASANSVSTATTNPAYSNTGAFYVGSGGLRTPLIDSNMYADYSYYLSRRDMIVVDKTGKFSIISGKPADFPASPPVSENYMVLGSVYIAPYPSISETLARILNTPFTACITRNTANIRYTMKDIGLFDDRIKTLEYYNALNLLQKQTADLKILDDQGLDRFKNGVFADGFVDHSLGATDNPDYNISVDKSTQVIRPIFEMDAFDYNYLSGSNVSKTGNLISLNYSNAVLVQQKNVTSFRNIEQSVYRFIGTLTVSPESDTWCDTNTVDKIISVGDQRNSSVTLTTEWGSWQTYATGYNLYARPGDGGRQNTVGDPRFAASKYGLKFSYSSYAEAYAASTRLPEVNSSGNRSSGGGDSGYIETLTSQTRTGTQLIADNIVNSQQLGTFVTDISVEPYIRPQTLSIYVKGVKARTTYYAFFDEENMSDYVVSIIPGVDPANTSAVSVLSPYRAYSEEGAPIVTDDYGEAIIYLRLPDSDKRFKLGTKQIVVTDSPTNSIDSSSYAETSWTAIGLDVQKQNTILSTGIPTIRTITVTDSRVLQTITKVGPSCMAYSFKVDVPPTEEGVFLTSVDVFIEEMNPTLGVWFEIREMDAGGVTRNQVPYSEVWMKRDDPRIKTNPFINGRTFTGTSIVDPDTTNPYRLNTYINGDLIPTNVNFNSPVFLYNNTQYAFIIHTEGLNPDTYFYISRLGETDLVSGNPVTSRKLTGTLYTTNNNLNYDIVPDVDLLCNFWRADFTVGAGTAYFGNKPTEFLNLKSGAGNFNKSGETIGSSEVLTLSSPGTSNTVSVGDILTGSTSTTVANVIAISSGSYYTDGIGFSNTESLTVANSSGGNKSITTSITSVIAGSGTLRRYDSANNLMIIDNSNGKFFANALIKGQFSGVTGRIYGFDSWEYSTTNVKPGALSFNGSSISFEERGCISSSNTHSDYQNASEDDSSDFAVEMKLLSRKDEMTIFGTTGQNSTSATLQATFTNSSKYLSPVIDTSRTRAVYVHNVVNNNDPVTGGIMIYNTVSTGNTIIVGDKFVGEDSGITSSVTNIGFNNEYTMGANGYIVGETITVKSSGDATKYITATVGALETSESGKTGGSLINKYISKVITLADGQDAEDLKTILTVYRPANTDVKVWVKFKNGEDGQLIGDKDWVKLDYNTDFYSPSTADSFIELDYTIPAAYMSNGYFYYVSGGTTYQSFKQFQIKIGLFASDSAVVPKVSDVRCIALQK